MLVCSVSLRPARKAIAADLAEAAAAEASLDSGNVVFATLVDDPASVGDTVDAYLGEIMLEAASAADAVDVVFVYGAGIDEAATSADAPDATVTGALVARHAMIEGVFINSDGTARQANVNGIGVNL